MEHSHTLTEIEALAKPYADARATLADRITALEDEITGAKRRALRGIKAAVARVAETEAQLTAAIDASRDQFAKPRTRVFHGVKLGLQKGKGGISWDNAEQVVRLIRKHFPEQFDVLVKTTEVPIKDALSQLPAADLKRIAVNSTEAGDAIVIKPADSQVDKLVDALLKGMRDELEEAA